jgi:hypothetical protein
VLTSTVFASFIAAAATIILTSNLALADWKASFQQKPQMATQSAFPGGSAAIMPYVNEIDSGSSSSSSFLASSSTAKDPYEHIGSNNINPLQPRDGSPLASITNNNNVAAAYTTTTTGNTGFTPTTRTIQPMTTTSEPSHAQRQQQNPTSPQVVTPRSPSQVTMMTVSLGGQITCKPTDLLRNGKCIPQPPTCEPIGVSQYSKCSPRPSYHHHSLMLTQAISRFLMFIPKP